MVMLWRLIIEDFLPTIQNIYGVYNIIANTLSRFPSTSVDKYEPNRSKVQCRANKLLEIIRAKNSKYFYPLSILNVQREQQKS